MTMCPGTGLLSQMTGPGAGAGSCRESELARGLVTLPVWGVLRWPCWHLVPPGPVPGRWRAGARRGSAACGRSRWWRSSSRAAWQWPRRWRRIPGTAWRSAPPGSAPTAARPSPARDVPVPDGQIRAADRRGQPGLAGQLAGVRERLMSPISASMTSAVNWPTPGSVVKTLTRGSALACWRSSPSIRSMTGARPAGDRQAVGDDLPGHRGQVQSGQPAAAGPGQVAAGPVEAEISHHRVDPVLLLGAQPDQPGPVPQQGAELPDRRRGDPRLRQQVRPQQLRQDRRAGPCRSSAAPRRSPCTAAGAPGAPRSRSPPAAGPASPSRTRPRTPPVSPGADRRSAGASARIHSPRSCSAAPGRPQRPPPPGSACGARRYDVSDIAGPPFPSLESLTRSVLLPG